MRCCVLCLLVLLSVPSAPTLSPRLPTTNSPSPPRPNLATSTINTQPVTLYATPFALLPKDCRFKVKAVTRATAGGGGAHADGARRTLARGVLNLSPHATIGDAVPRTREVVLRLPLEGGLLRSRGGARSSGGGAGAGAGGGTRSSGGGGARSGGGGGGGGELVLRLTVRGVWLQNLSVADALARADAREREAAAREAAEAALRGVPGGGDAMRGQSAAAGAAGAAGGLLAATPQAAAAAAAALAAAPRPPPTALTTPTAPRTTAACRSSTS